MIVYETANGQLYTRPALSAKTVGEARRGWDKETQGSFPRDEHVWFSDWLIEAINVGVIKQREVND